MKKATTLLAICAFGWSAPSIAQAMTSNCDNGCTVTVTIPKGCNAGKGVKVSLDPIRIKVNKSAKITWKMGTPGWTFAANGIDFPKWTGDAETAFKGKPTFDTDSQGKPTKDFAVTNESKKPGTHKYDVNLIAPDKSTCKHDPTVVNW